MEKDDKEHDLNELKRNYKFLQEKYNLPSFENLNQDFGIEKAAEVETDFLIREIRKFIADKSSNYLRFIDTVLNPANAPMFVFSFIKMIGTEEKNKLAEIYKKLIKEEIKLIELDLDFSEEKEAKFIREFYEFWRVTKKELLEIVEKAGKNSDNKSEENSRGYFG